MKTESEFQLQQMYDVLCNKMVKRGIDIVCLEKGEPDIQARTATQTVKVNEGIDTLTAKKLVKLLKSSGAKVQTAIQGDELRVTGKKRDDLQSAIALMKESKQDIPLQYKNFRD